MSATYKMRIGDDVREMVVTLSRTGSEDWQEPTEAVLKIKPRYGSLVEKTLERGDEDIDGQWVYQWTEDEIEDLGAGRHKAQIYATFNDGLHATFPTKDFLVIEILPMLE
jgi:hypothetical protein